MSLAKKCHEKNSKRDPRYSELLIHRLIKTGTSDQISVLMDKYKYHIHDFTFTVPELITKLKEGTAKNPLLKKHHLAILFDKQPYCVTTFKAIGAEYNRKAKSKP